MNSVEAAWLAGLFDGEGSVSKYDVHHKNGKTYEGWQITLPNTHLEAVERCRSLTGVGKVNVKTRRIAHYKEQYVWVVGKKPEIIRVLEQIAPHCVIKRKVVDEFLAAGSS